MHIILDNNDWMIYNSFLACLAVLFGVAFVEVKEKYSKVILAVLWLLFLPNTLYIFTDLLHLVQDWYRVSISLRPLFVLQYAVFELVGVVTFIVGFLPFEKMVSGVKSFKKNRTTVLIACNFIIAFGMVLGRVERNNSWDVFFAPQKVISSAIHVLTSFDLLGLTVLFGLLCNFVYFLFRNMLIKRTKSFIHVSD